MDAGPLSKDFSTGFFAPANGSSPHKHDRAKHLKGKDIPIHQLTHADVEAAQQRIAGMVKQTPLVESRVGGARVWLKCECLQTGRAFKLRGATNRLLQLSHEQRERGVVAYSSGNHAQGVAIAAKRLGMPAAIVMPADAPAVKVEATRGRGAEVIFYDRRTRNREEIASRLADERGAVLVPSFDDPAIVAGQGTVGIEILEQLGRPPAMVVVPTGGGGLAAGIALACEEAQIVCVEPEGWDDMGRSLEGGAIVPVEPDAPDTICDSLLAPLVSPITFGILQARSAKAVTVSDDEVREAVRFLWREHELVAEPGGAAALAALLAGKVEPVGDTVVVVSGGNIDPELHARLVE